MNALPTSDRLAFTHSDISCPVCSSGLTSNHFFDSDCFKSCAVDIWELCIQHNIPKPLRLNFTKPYSLIFWNSLWKAFCKARHSAKKLHIKEISLIARNFFVREILIAKVLFPSDYLTLTIQPVNLSTLPDLYNFVNYEENEKPKTQDNH